MTIRMLGILVSGAVCMLAIWLHHEWIGMAFLTASYLLAFVGD